MIGRRSSQSLRGYRGRCVPQRPGRLPSRLHRPERALLRAHADAHGETVRLLRLQPVDERHPRRRARRVRRVSRRQSTDPSLCKRSSSSAASSRATGATALAGRSTGWASNDHADEADPYNEHWGESAYIVAMAWHHAGRTDATLRTAADQLVAGFNAKRRGPHMRSFNWQCRSAVATPFFLR